jgi:hypothetical protein
MIVEWFFGFYSPWLRRDGKLSLRGIFGHCDAWGFTAEGTWLFLDPQGEGVRVRVDHRHDEVKAHLEARFILCDSILRLPAVEPVFACPLHGPMTCASVCGALVGIRALLPWTLRRKLLAAGAEVIHEAERRPGRQEGAPP